MHHAHQASGKKEDNKQKVHRPGPPICLGPHSSCRPAAPGPRRAAALRLAVRAHHPSPHVVVSIVLVHPPAHQMVCPPTNRQHLEAVCCATLPPTGPARQGSLLSLCLQPPCCCSGTTVNPKGVEMTHRTFLVVWLSRLRELPHTCFDLPHMLSNSPCRSGTTGAPKGVESTHHNILAVCAFWHAPFPLPSHLSFSPCSGTTGAPKGVEITHRNLVSSIAGGQELFV